MPGIRRCVADSSSHCKFLSHPILCHELGAGRAKPVHAVVLVRFRRGWGAGFSWLRYHGNALSINTLGMLNRLPFQFKSPRGDVVGS